MPRRSIHPIDTYVGARIRMRRHMLGMTQTALANALGLTFQQVQKYEKGTNRVSASKLQQIGEALKVPAPFFFEGAPGAGGAKRGAAPAIPVFAVEFLTSRDGVALAKAFGKIRDPKVRHRLVALIERIAQQFRS